MVGTLERCVESGWLRSGDEAARPPRRWPAAPDDPLSVTPPSVAAGSGRFSSSIALHPPDLDCRPAADASFGPRSGSGRKDVHHDAISYACVSLRDVCPFHRAILVESWWMRVV